MRPLRSSSSFSSCFLPSPSPFPSTSSPSLTSSLFHTHLGLFILSWSHHTSLLHFPSSRSRSLSLHFPSLSPSLSFHLSLSSFFPFNKSGSKTLTHNNNNTKLTIHWDFSRVRFGPGPEPVSGFYIAVVCEDGEIALLVGDDSDKAKAKIKGIKGNHGSSSSSSLEVVRREHVIGMRKRRRYSTRAGSFGGGGRNREVWIECDVDREDPRLIIGIDSKRVLQIKHLKWKFRGNERVEFDDEESIQVSWDVYNWIFKEDVCNDDDGYALFTFRFEKKKVGLVVENEGEENCDGEFMLKERMFWRDDDSWGLNFERKKMRRKMKLMRSTRSPSCSSLSSASSGCGSVMEWESVEENELKGGPTGFSLLVYAWKR